MVRSAMLQEKELAKFAASPQGSEGFRRSEAIASLREHLELFWSRYQLFCCAAGEVFATNYM
jgi:hypothetical protein